MIFFKDYNPFSSNLKSIVIELKRKISQSQKYVRIFDVSPRIYRNLKNLKKITTHLDRIPKSKHEEISLGPATV